MPTTDKDHNSKKARNPEPRILLFDLESTNLNANFGFILCICYKWLGEKRVHTISIDQFDRYETDRTNDREVVRAFARVFEEADIVVGHYSTKFDAPYISARLLYHGYKPLPPTRHIDTWRISKDRLRLNSNRLASIGEFFSLQDKTSVSGPHWIKAMAGHKASLQYVKEHCRIDVDVLEQAYLKLRALMPNHPNGNLVRGLRKACPICGSKKLTRRGWLLSYTSRKPRFVCPQGHWSHGNPEKIKDVVR